VGHRYLLGLPQTRNWIKVIDLLKSTDDPAAIAWATTQAANYGLELAKRDIGIAATVYLLMKLIWSSRSDNFPAELNRLSMSLPEQASLLDVVGAFDEALDHRLTRMDRRSDLAEMARFSAVETLEHLSMAETGSLFGVSLEQTHQTLKRFATPKQFGMIGKLFFGKFLYRFLDYHLSRELPNHIGLNQTFSDVNHCQAFKSGLELHCIETVRIIQDFSGCWPSATDYQEGITEENVRTKFVPVAIKKIKAELKMREGIGG